MRLPMKPAVAVIEKGIEEIEYVAVSYTKNTILTIPTTKKAKGVIYFLTAYTGYLFWCIDGVDDNYVYRSDGISNVRLIFNENTIVSDVAISSNNQTLRIGIIY